MYDTSQRSYLFTPTNHILGFVIINVVIYLLSRLAGFSTKYPAYGTMLVWAVAINLTSVSLITFFSRFPRWTSSLKWVVAFDLLTSLIPLALIYCVLKAGPKTELFGAGYVLLVFSKCFLLVGYALANAPSGRVKAPVFAWVFAISLLTYIAATPWVALNAWPDGDEPHYLLLTYSLIADRDFDLSNNYRQGDYKTFYPPDLTDHHTLINSRGQEFPIHDVGVSVLLLPGYAVAGRLGVMLELNLIAALLALGMYALAIDIGATARAALTMWALFAFTSPLVVFSSQVSPEVVGGACSVWAVVAFGRFVKTNRQQPLALAGLLLSVLPWFNVRFWMILVPMLSAISLFVLVQKRSRSKLEIVKSLLVLILPTALSLGLFLLFDMHYYNTALPNAGYFLRVAAMQEPLFTTNVQIGLLGLFFDKTFGLLTTAPVYVVALAGAFVLLRHDRWIGGTIIFVSFVYILFSGSSRYWYGGWSPPARLICASSALIAPLASLVISKTKFGLISVLGAWSLLVGTGFTAFPLTRYSAGNTAALGGFFEKHTGLDYGVIFPSLIRAAPSDYLLAAFWTVLTAISIWFLLRRQPSVKVRTAPTSKH